MSLVGGLWSIQGHFGASALTMNPQTLRLIHRHTAEKRAIPISSSWVYVLIPGRAHNQRLKDTCKHTQTDMRTQNQSLLPLFLTLILPRGQCSLLGKVPVTLISIRSYRESCSSDGYLCGPSSTFPWERKEAWVCSVAARLINVLYRWRWGISGM